MLERRPQAGGGRFAVADRGLLRRNSISRGAAPAWLRPGERAQQPGGRALRDGRRADGGRVPLRQHTPGRPSENPANKILWIVRSPRDGSDLTINAHPEGSATPVVKMVQPADSGPGEIYPSIVDVPTPGCWVFDLAWASHHATLALPYG